MDTPRYRIGNDLTILWAISNRDGSPYNLEGKEVRLFVTNERGREEVDVILSTLPDGSVNNVIRWDFKGEDQRTLGGHTLTVEIQTAEDHREIKKDFCEAFVLVGSSCAECIDDGDANIMDGGELILSSRLDIYMFGGVGQGLVSEIYNEDDFGSVFSKGSKIDTFNAHAINTLYERLRDLKIGDVTDIAISNPKSDNLLVFNGHSWVNVTAKSLFDKYGTGSSGGSGSGSGSGSSGDSFWYMGDDGKVHIDYDIYVAGNATMEGDTSSGGEGQDTAGAGGQISCLSDVLLTSLNSGDILVYDTGRAKWVNQPMPKGEDVDLTGYATEAWVNLYFTKTEQLDALSNLLHSMWRIDEATGELVTDMPVRIKNNLIVEGENSSGDEGEPVIIGTTSIVVDGVSYPATNGVIDLSKAFEGLGVEVDLSDYYTKAEVDSRIAGIDLSPYATKTEVNAIEQSLVSMNDEIAKKAYSADVYTKTETDGKVATINSSITALDTKYAPVKTWYDALGSLIVKDGNNVRIKTNLIVEGDTSADGEGGASVGITGITLNGTTYRDTDGDGIIDLGEITGGGGTITEITSAMITSALGYTPYDASNPNGYITASALNGYITESAVNSKLAAYQPLSTAINTGNISAQSVAYATNAGAVGGIGIYNGTEGIATISSGGVMEVGQYIDFHKVGSTKDYSVRLHCSNDNGVSIHLPSAQGTLALSSQIPTQLSQLTDNVGYALATSLTNYLPLSGGTLTGALTVNSTIKASSVICGTSRLRVNATDNAGNFGYIKAETYNSNRGVLRIGTNYGGSETITNAGVDVDAINIYRGVVGIGGTIASDTLYSKQGLGVSLFVSGSTQVTGQLAVSSTFSADGTAGVAGVFIRNEGGIELSHASTPYIDFHLKNATSDYSNRLICDTLGRLQVSNNFRVTGSTWLQGTVIIDNTTTINGNLIVTGDISA